MIKPLLQLAHDWYPGGVPANVALGPDVYLDTTYSFASFSSEIDPGLILGEASGAYDRTAFIVGPRGQVSVGAYTCLNGTYLICDESIRIGAHCFLAWGSVITDCWPGPDASVRMRQAAIKSVATDPQRRLRAAGVPRPVTIEDNAWIGFGAVILPGVTLGTGCVIGCKTIIAEDVPPYAIVAGDPPRIIRHLEPISQNHRSLGTRLWS
jgi:acetyltransferase-like isoleucine patch superfamily enzyme